MNDGIQPKKDQSVDQLNEDLYNPKKTFEQRPRRKIHDEDVHLDQDFPVNNVEEFSRLQTQRKLPVSFFKKIFLVTLGFFIVSALVAFLSIYKNKKTVSNDLISMEILGQPFVDSGEPFEVQVRIQNFNDKNLELPDLVLSYPKDSALDAEPVFFRRSLEDIGNGQQSSEKFDITLFGQEGDLRTINAVLEYRIEGSSSIFTKTAEHEIIIRSTPTKVSVKAPDEIVRNQQIDLVFDVVSNTNNQINDVLLHVDYPRGFEFISADPVPTYDNNVWYFSNVDGEKQQVKLSGRLAALEGQGQSFSIEFGKQNEQQKNTIETIFNALVHTVHVQNSFIATNLFVNDENNGEITLQGGDDVQGEIIFTNTLDTVLQDVVITARIDGNLLDPTSVRTQNGFFDSNQKRIVWDSSRVQSLKNLEPGAEGSLSFSLNTQDLVSQFGTLEKPYMNIDIDVTGREINGQTRQAVSVSRAHITANSDISLVTKANYLDGPFKNYGAMPPRVNLTTSYTVTLQATNSSNDVHEAKLRTILPPYVTWLNTLAPSIERNNVSYNTGTRELVWEIGTLKAGVGTGTTSPRQLSFQVEILPSLSQLGQPVNLTGDITLSGVDSFTNAKLIHKQTPVSNRLSNDGIEDGADGRIKQ